MNHFKYAAKAYVAALIALLSYLAPVVDDGLSAGNVVGALLAAVIAWQATYWTSNRGEQFSEEG